MPRVMLVFGQDVLPGADEEFNRWYDTHHMPKFSAKAPGVALIRRFYGKNAKPHYISVYEFESLAAMRRATKSSQWKSGDKDAVKQLGKTVRAFTSNLYLEISRREPKKPRRS